jgi:hypothetical protein
MSTVIAVLAIIAVLGFSAVGTWIVLWWAMSGPSERDRIVREAHERARLAGEIDQLELAYAAADWDEARERLWDAIRDEHTNHQGDQS